MWYSDRIGIHRGHTNECRDTLKQAMRGTDDGKARVEKAQERKTMHAERGEATSIKVNTNVKVRATLYSHQEDCEIKAGWKGVVIEHDDSGDACIKFEESEVEKWVMKRDFFQLGVLEAKAEEDGAVGRILSCQTGDPPISVLGIEGEDAAGDVDAPPVW